MSSILISFIFFMVIFLLIMSFFNLILLLKLMELNMSRKKNERFKVLRIFIDRHKI